MDLIQPGEDFFQFGAALFHGPRRPGLEPQKDERAERGHDEHGEGESGRPGKLTARCGRVRIHNRISPKKYRPPRPMDVKGGCSPQNILESAEVLSELGAGCKKNL